MVTLPGPGPINVDAAVTAPLGTGESCANLDLKLRLLDAQGRVLATADPPPNGANVVASLGASLSAPAPAGGQFFVELTGTGWGDPATTGYSSYGSLGGRRRGQPAAVAGRGCGLPTT